MQSTATKTTNTAMKMKKKTRKLADFEMKPEKDWPIRKESMMTYNSEPTRKIGRSVRSTATTATRRKSEYAE